MPLCGPGRLWRESAENTGSCSSPAKPGLGKLLSLWAVGRGCGAGQAPLQADALGPGSSCGSVLQQICKAPNFSFLAVLGGGSETSTGTACKNAGCQAVSCHWAAWLLTSPLDPIKRLALAGWKQPASPGQDSAGEEEGGKEALGQKSRVPLAVPGRPLPGHLADPYFLPPASSFRLSRGRRARWRPACSTQECPSSMRGKHPGHLG